MSKGSPEELRDAATAVAERLGADDLRAGDLERSVSEIAAVIGRLEEEERADPGFRRDGFGLRSSLGELREAVVEARKGLDQRDRFLTGWQDFMRAIRGAIEK